MNKECIKFIEENKDRLCIIGGVSLEKINEMEDDLGVDFPLEYKQYLSQFGLISGYGITIEGCGKNRIKTVVDETKRYRMHGLENNYIVVCDIGDWIYCLNTKTNDISSWDIGDPVHIKKNESFSEFFLERLSEGKNVLEDD